MFAFGDIVLARFPFTDLTGEKRRPALVVSRGAAQQGDVIVCFITSVARSAPDSAPLPVTPETGLKAPSVARFDKLATLNASVIAGRLGRAPADWLDKHRTPFLNVFGFS